MAAPFTNQEKHIGALAILMLAVEKRNMFTTEQLLELDRMSRDAVGVSMTSHEAAEAALSLLRRIVE